MNLLVLVLAFCASMMLGVAADRHLADHRNVTRLAEHFGWARSDAAAAYAMSRQTGFGAAYRTMRMEHRQLVA
jgi:hypothetical protein